MWKSHAEWPHEAMVRDIYGNSFSHDNHHTQSQAAAVCRGLEREGLGGCGVVFPLRTWVTVAKRYTALAVTIDTSYTESVTAVIGAFAAFAYTVCSSFDYGLPMECRTVNSRITKGSAFRR